jgi:hypothetical protein
LAGLPSLRAAVCSAEEFSTNGKDGAVDSLGGHANNISRFNGFMAMAVGLGGARGMEADLDLPLRSHVPKVD